MRATATLNLFLGLPATRVHAIDFELDQIFGVVRLAQRRLRCPGCEFSTRANYDQPAQAVSVATPRRVRPTTAHTGFAPPIGAPHARWTPKGSRSPGPAHDKHNDPGCAPTNGSVPLVDAITASASRVALNRGRVTSRTIRIPACS